MHITFYNKPSNINNYFNSSHKDAMYNYLMCFKFTYLLWSSGMKEVDPYHIIWVPCGKEQATGAEGWTQHLCSCPRTLNKLDRLGAGKNKLAQKYQKCFRNAGLAREIFTISMISIINNYLQISLKGGNWSNFMSYPPLNCYVIILFGHKLKTCYWCHNKEFESCTLFMIKWPIINTDSSYQ